jgi:transcriptional regulator with XRE-family HTH domain
MKEGTELMNYCINKIQQEQGLTLKSIADRLEISQEYLSKLKNGHKKINYRMTKKIMDLAKVTAASITAEVNFGSSQTQEPAPNYMPTPNIIQELLTDARHKRSVIDKMMDDQKSRTEQMDKVIAELQRMNDLIILKLRN